MKLRLLTRVLVRLEQCGKSAGYGLTDLIVIPENCETEFLFCGQVCAIGSRAVTDVAVGDHVILDTYSQYIFESGGTRYAILDPNAISAILPSGKPEYMSVVPTGAREYAEA